MELCRMSPRKYLPPLFRASKASRGLVPSIYSDPFKENSLFSCDADCPKALPPQVSCDISLDTARGETHPDFVRSGEAGEGQGAVRWVVPGLRYAKDSSDIPIRRRLSHDSCIGLSGGVQGAGD
jgi:hypothetical protein